MAEDGLNIQRVADQAATQLEDLLAKAQGLTRESSKREFAAIDEDVLAAFESGRYSVALFLNEAVRVAYEKCDAYDKAAATLNFQLSARSGIRGKRPLEIAKFVPPGTRIDPRALLHVASHQSLVGEFAAARRTLARVEAEPLGPEYDLDLALRRAQIDRTPADARRALDIAEDKGLPYRRSTALVIAGFIDLAAGSSSAQGHFEAVLDLDRHVSWLYRAECWLGLGLIALQARQPPLAYRYLIAAQYVYGFLGLQALPHPGLSNFGAPAVSSAFHLLQSDRLSGLSREKCHELRRQALDKGLLRTLITDELGGFKRIVPNAPDPARYV